LVVANQRALEPIIGERIPTAVPDRIFDKDMTISLGGETVLLHRVAPSHSDSMIMVLFPGYKALQCTDACESKSMPYNDFLDFYYDGWIETLDWVAQQDVDVIDRSFSYLRHGGRLPRLLYFVERVVACTPARKIVD
jgi:hypothetical protein